MPLPRLVATDLDGTLLHTDGTVTDRTRRVLARLEEHGVVVVFVTGRPVRWMADLWQHVGEHGVAICSNGAIVYDVRRHRIVKARTLSRSVGLKVADLVRTAIPGTSYALEKTTGFAKEESYLSRAPMPQETVVGRLEEIFDDEVVKLLARHEERPPEAFWHAVDQLVGHLVVTTWSSTSALAEISAPGVTKASTLEQLCGERGIAPEDVLAFGDMPNDIPLLTWAGMSYAMAGGHPSVVAAAQHLAPANDEDGVAVILEGMFDLEHREVP
jgi:Cof subfamily protein (haloacid dehalogenase superfamily)